MPFPEDVVQQAWLRADSRCECGRANHPHGRRRCNKTLVEINKGREGEGAWDAHRRSAGGSGTLNNCEILCWECHQAISWSLVFPATGSRVRSAQVECQEHKGMCGGRRLAD